MSLSRAPRRALLIGNDAYLSTTVLRNAVNDVTDLGAALRDAEFHVDVVTDASLSAMETAVDSFVDSLQAGDVAYFHFSGHGLQIDGENYLVPVDFQLKDAASVPYDTYSLSKLQDRLAGSASAFNLITLDACRNNGFQSARGGGGLAALNSARGTFIAFATGPGRTADDNSAGRNGRFTAALLQAMAQPGLEVAHVFRRVVEQVSDETNGQQIPWISSSMVGEFYFRPGEGMAAANPEAEIAYWDSVKDVRSRAAIESYLNRYPEGQFAELARLRVAQLDPDPGAQRQNEVDGLAYVWVPAGRFTRGCSVQDKLCQPDELPRTRVEISHGYWLGQTEVTVEAYRKFAEATGRALPAEPLVAGVSLNPRWNDAKQPMTQVSWDDAAEYCAWAGGRLPTEAEWEFAALAGERSSQPTPDVAWVVDNSGGRPREGGTRAPNAWGLTDMLGNVWEYTADFHGPYAPTAVTDPTGPDTGLGRVIRGGSWNKPAASARVSARGWVPVPFRANDIGFRCVAQ